MARFSLPRLLSPIGQQPRFPVTRDGCCLSTSAVLQVVLPPQSRAGGTRDAARVSIGTRRSRARGAETDTGSLASGSDARGQVRGANSYTGPRSVGLVSGTSCRIF